MGLQGKGGDVMVVSLCRCRAFTDRGTGPRFKDSVLAMHEPGRLHLSRDAAIHESARAVLDDSTSFATVEIVNAQMQERKLHRSVVEKGYHIYNPKL